MRMTDEELEELSKYTRERKAAIDRLFLAMPAWQQILITILALSPVFLFLILGIIAGLKQDGIIAP